MKTVPLKKVPFFDPTGTKQEFDYLKNLIVAVLNPMDGKGAGIDEQRKSNRLLDVLENVKEDATDVQFEDADHKYLCEKVYVLRFPFNHKVFEQFIDDVRQLDK